MAETTGISWCHATLNFWVGCTKVSNGPEGACEFCYAESWAKRWPAFKATWGAGAARVLFKHLVAKAMNLERLAIASGAPFYCFSNSLSDIFDNEVPIEWLAEAFRIMRLAPHVTFLLLTKRAPNIVKRVQAAGGLPANTALMITVVTQPEADRDIPHLLKAKAVLKPLFVGISMEPLMGAVDLTRIDTMAFQGGELVNALTGELKDFLDCQVGRVPRVDWVITGGESGAKARPSHPDWFRSIRDQCAAAGVPFHHKQNGEWASSGPHNRNAVLDLDAGRIVPQANQVLLENGLGVGGRTLITKVGKKASGRLLDGVLHDAMPVAA